MIRITDILDNIAEYNPDADFDLIERAYIFSAKVHDGQVRLSGEPYLSHPLEVASILAEMRLDAISVASGLLHDVIEDSHTTEAAVKDMFGEQVCLIVSGVTKLSSLPFKSAQARQAESIRKMILAMANDLRVILIKLADRIHNMRTLKYHKEYKRIRIARETQDIYAPIAARLGMYLIKNELEELSFKYTNPEQYNEIKTRVNKEKDDQEKYIEVVQKYIQNKMDQADLKCEVLGRSKNYFSIYAKMMDQDLSFEDIYDITAFRIILETMPQCYEALGIIHALWKPIDNKFKDYVGRPKPNMYQSLHTTVIGPFGERIEIQIRTKEMDSVAKSGIAAHWSYKEGRVASENISEKFVWLQNLVENQENFRDPDEFLENVRIDLFPDEVYIFTPNSDVKSLPKGATPIDFAYAIHSEVGNRCTAAKVNGKIVPLKHKLSTGDIVEITTSKGQHPSKDWLKFVKTVKARSKIKQRIKIEEKERSLTLGREMCEKAFRKYGFNFTKAIKTEEMDKTVEALGYKTVDDLVASVGYGKLTPMQFLGKYAPKDENLKADESFPGKMTDKVRKPKDNIGVIVSGMEDILIRYGKCCNPLPGDMIVGYITQGHGVTIHRMNCVNVGTMNPERQITVEWDKEVSENYPVKIRVVVQDRVGLLADIAAQISINEANIMSSYTQESDGKISDMFFTVNVKNVKQLDKIIISIKKVKHVYEVKRIEH